MIADNAHTFGVSIIWHIATAPYLSDKLQVSLNSSQRKIQLNYLKTD